MAVDEYIIVCIDNSAEAYRRRTYAPLIVALKEYCKTKLADNSKTQVTLFSMGSTDFDSMWLPATDYKEIECYLPSISPGAGCLLFEDALINAAGLCNSKCPPNKQKRILFLVGSPVDVNCVEMMNYGSKLKGFGIAVDVFSFYLGKKLKNTIINNQYGRTELNAFVGAANYKGNSHIKHVGHKDIKPRSSSIRRALATSMFRKRPRHHKKANGKNHAAGANKHVRSEE